MSIPSIIGLVGPIRAGKTTIAKYLVEKYGYIHASNSQVLVNILVSLNMSPTREHMQLLGNSIFEQLGNDAIANFRVKTLGSNKLVIDGIRYIEEIDCYKQIKDFKLIAVNASLDERFRRSAIDSIKDANLDVERFHALSSSRSEADVPNIMCNADATINNIFDLDVLKVNLDEIINNWD